MADKNKVLDLIEKLMRRTSEKGATEAEVESALAMAQKLMAKHNIEMAEVLAAQQQTYKSEDVVKQTAKSAAKIEKFEQTLMHVVCVVCDVKSYVAQGHKKDVVFYGMPQDVQAACLLYIELIIATKALARGRLGKWTQRHWAYCKGFAYGLYTKAVEQNKTPIPTSTACTAIISTKALSIADFGTTLGLKQGRTGRERNLGSDEYSMGHQDAQDYELGADRSQKLPRDSKRLN